MYRKIKCPHCEKEVPLSEGQGEIITESEWLSLEKKLEKAKK